MLSNYSRASTKLYKKREFLQTYMSEGGSKNKALKWTSNFKQSLAQEKTTTEGKKENWMTAGQVAAHLQITEKMFNGSMDLMLRAVMEEIKANQAMYNHAGKVILHSNAWLSKHWCTIYEGVQDSSVSTQLEQLTRGSSENQSIMTLMDVEAASSSGSGTAGLRAKLQHASKMLSQVQKEITEARKVAMVLKSKNGDWEGLMKQIGEGQTWLDDATCDLSKLGSVEDTDEASGDISQHVDAISQTAETHTKALKKLCKEKKS